MRGLDFKNVIKLHEIYETKNSFYMVLDMLEGGNLLDLISNKSLTNFNVMNIMSGLVEAVKYIHS